MKIGVPGEIKNQEGRVALTPAAVAALVQSGQQVLIQQGAGVRAGFADQHYQEAGAQLCTTPQQVYDEAEVLVKVKEPQASEVGWLRPGQLLFCYLHLAAAADLTSQLQERRVSALAFETVSAPDGKLPLLAPMSRIAGALAIQLASVYLTAVQGGKGCLMAAIPGLPRTQVVVLGGGVAGTQAALLAAQMGAQVKVFEQRPEVCERLGQLHPGVTPLPAVAGPMGEAIASADLLVGAVLVPGAKAPKLVPRSWVAAMPKGSVIVDISVDQGGCIETIHATTHTEPTYVEEGVVHCAITNLPGIVPHSATQALSSVLLSYVQQLAQAGTQWQQLPWVQSALNVHQGKVQLAALTR